MENGKYLRLRILLQLIAFIALGTSLLLSQLPAHAAVNCLTVTSTSTTDFDLDGFTDYQECYGITLRDGSCVCGSAGCCGSTTNTPPSNRAIRLDPNTRDVFVMLVRATSTNIPWMGSTSSDYAGDAAYWFAYISSPVSQGGLGITVHEIGTNQVVSLTTRYVTSTSKQKAVKITESLDATSTNPLGSSNTGTPDGLDLTTVYTQRIINFIKSTCGSAYGTANCADSSGAWDNTAGKPPNLALTQKYIMHTISHEFGHVLGPLAPVYNANYGGYHYGSGTDVIMDQSIYYTSKNGVITFYSGTTFTSTDQSRIKLE